MKNPLKTVLARTTALITGTVRVPSPIPRPVPDASHQVRLDTTTLRSMLVPDMAERFDRLTPTEQKLFTKGVNDGEWSIS